MIAPLQPSATTEPLQNADLNAPQPMISDPTNDSASNDKSKQLTLDSFFQKSEKKEKKEEYSPHQGPKSMQEMQRQKGFPTSPMHDMLAHLPLRVPQINRPTATLDMSIMHVLF